ncbi:hypothetical protein BW730_08700 [Tessaracoccus aquimaris]|uniref:Acyltransferase n=1 Tax=Tessaracoccus aquimaris TaxID=1332264 RepID=A0A1Q2CN71_9ACTN|nr:acyltransferase family protein [Tessaracoccus aquimaris]AQP47556.1 hypothetical protein BW730_08700 [Tessaracoccus aquimaris]
MNSPASTYVPSLDGLRTIAVGLVIAFHLSVPGLAPGFAGVDVFFVLSGYLITAGLLADTAKHGRPRFARFWQRRFLRLLPAATLVLIAVLTYATFLMPVYRRAAAAGDVGWTAVYLANWHFMEANSYFSSDGSASLLLHMWSLAVEEQFYFVWPIAIGLIAWLARKARLRTALIAVTAVLTLASIARLPQLYLTASVDRAYMGTDSKAFEPLLGALLAILVSDDRVRDALARHHKALTAVGIAAVAAVLPFLGGPSPFYFFGGALLLSLGVVVLMAALVCGPGTLVERALAWGPMAYLGRISYGLYLWHWPWAVWMGIAHVEHFQPARAAVALAGTVVTSVASYHLVEQPIRRGRLTAWFTPRRVAAAVAVVMAVILGWSATLQATLGVVPAKHWIVVTGDSVPLKLMSSLDAAATERGWAVDSAARGGCTPLAVELQEYKKPPHEGPGDCRVLAQLQDSLIDRHHPDIVFWWSRYETHQRWYEGRLIRPEDPEFWDVLEAETRTTIDRLTRDGATLVIAQPERPGPGLLKKCPVGDTDCFPLDDYALNHDEYRMRWNEMVRRIAAQDPRVRTFQMDPLFCDDPEPSRPQSPSACDDAQPDGGSLRDDGIHVTIDAYGRQTADKVLAAVLDAAAS